jgi:hypothetical protein
MGSALHLANAFGKLWCVRKIFCQVVAGYEPIQLAFSIEHIDTAPIDIATRE